MKSITLHLTLLFFLTFFSAYAQVSSETQDAYQLFKDGSYHEAIKSYHRILKFEARNPDAIYYLGMSLMNAQRNQEAELMFDSLEHIAPNYFPDFDFWRGQNYYLIGKFHESKKYLKQYERYGKDKKLIKLCRNLIPHVQTGIDISTQENDYKVELLDRQINTAHAEFNSLLSRNQKILIFNRQKKPPQHTPNTKNRSVKTKILFSNLQPNDQWGIAQNIYNQKTSSRHDVALQLFGNDKKMLICQDEDLKISVFKQNSWKIPRLMPKKMNSRKTENSGFLYAQGKKMVFSSNYKTKSLDLFQSTLQEDGSWSKPQPIAELNTSKDEGFPYLTNHGKTMYFSSQGHQNIGGYDIFVSHYNPVSKAWSKPRNIGFPINSSKDDYYFSIRGNVGYFTSNRNGGYGMEDIYRFYTFSKLKVAGNIIYRKNGMPCKKCRITAQNNVATFESMTDSTGSYTLYLPFHEDLRLRIYNGKTAFYEEDIRLTINTQRPTSQHRNYYIGYDSTHHRKTRITGNVMDRKSNAVLSSTIRLVNHSTQEVLDSVSTQTDKAYSIVLPNDTSMYRLEVTRKGYLYAHELIHTNIALRGLIKRNITLEKLRINQVCVLNDISFKLKSDFLIEDSFRELNRLANLLMQNPRLQIEISGHTDLVDDKGFNLSLSDKRAKAVKNYLLGKGIDAKRIRATGYGDTRSIAKEGKEKHDISKKNRIEIQVLSL